MLHPGGLRNVPLVSFQFNLGSNRDDKKRKEKKLLSNKNLGSCPTCTKSHATEGKQWRLWGGGGGGGGGREGGASSLKDMVARGRFTDWICLPRCSLPTFFVCQSSADQLTFKAGSVSLPTENLWAHMYEEQIAPPSPPPTPPMTFIF